MADISDRFYDSVLVVRCQAGDRAAFEELVERYQPRLRNFLRQMLHRHEPLDDILQEVWLDVFRGIARVADPVAFPAWLYRLVRNRAFRKLRRSREPMVALDNVDPPEAESEFSAEDAERVHAAIDQLPIEHREVILLRFVEDMSYEELAKVIGCELGTVRSRLHYAKRALRAIIGRQNENE